MYTLGGEGEGVGVPYELDNIRRPNKSSVRNSPSRQCWHCVLVEPFHVPQTGRAGHREVHAVAARGKGVVGAIDVDEGRVGEALLQKRASDGALLGRSGRGRR